jgi:hypothetical protein
VSLEEAKEIFSGTYIFDRKSDDPEQFRAIGWCRGQLCSVVYEIRRDSEGECYHLQLGRQPRRKNKAMPKTSKVAPTADEVAAMASRGEDVSGYFTNQFTVVRAKKIYIFYVSKTAEGYLFVALAEDGTCLSSWFSPSEDQAKSEARFAERLQRYKDHYPQGHELIWRGGPINPETTSPLIPNGTDSIALVEGRLYQQFLRALTV